MRHSIRDALDSPRARVYPRLLIAIYALGLAALFATSSGSVDLFGKPLGYDFIVFWSAGYLALAGDAAGAFDAKALYEAQVVATSPGYRGIYLWHYPPTFQLVAGALALMPYLVAYVVFMATTMALYVGVLRRLLDHPSTPWLLVALPGTFMCVFHGQNSMLNAALLAGAVLSLPSRPLLAGLCIGLLAYKPQLALLLPLVFAVTGNWAAFSVAGATGLAFAGLATLVLGVEPWRAFLANAELVRHILEAGFLPWDKMPSAFAFLRLLGVPQPLAWGAQITVGVAAAAITVAIWRRCGATRLAWAVLVTATVLLLPYVFDYEMTLLAVPLAILAADMLRRDATTVELAVLGVVAASPAVMTSIAGATGVQLGFPALVALLAVATSRALAEAREASADRAARAPTVPRPAALAMPG